MLVAHPQQHTFSSASAGVVDVGSALLPNTHTPAITHAIPTRQILLELQQQSSASGYPEVKSSTSSLPDPIPPTGEHPSVHNNAAVGTLPAADDTKAATGAASAPIVPPATHPPPGKAAALAARMSSKAAKRASLRSPLDVSAVLIPSAEVINDPSTGRTSHAVYDLYVQPCGRSDDWVIHRRFRNFVELARALVKVNKTTRVPSLPPKTWWPCTAKGFVEQRRVLLMKWLGEVLAVEELRHSKALRDFLGMPDCSMGPPSALRSTSLEGRGGVPGAFVSGLTHFPFLHTAHHCADRRDSGNRGFWRALTSPSSTLPRRRAATQPDLPPDRRSLNVKAHRRAVSVDSGAKGVEFGRAGGSNAAVSEEEGVEGLRLALYGNQGGASVVQRGALCSIM